MNKILFSGTISLILIITAFFIPIEWVQKPIFLLGIISIYTLLRKDILLWIIFTILYPHW